MNLSNACTFYYILFRCITNYLVPVAYRIATREVLVCQLKNFLHLPSFPFTFFFCLIHPHNSSTKRFAKHFHQNDLVNIISLQYIILVICSSYLYYPISMYCLTSLSFIIVFTFLILHFIYTKKMQ